MLTMLAERGISIHRNASRRNFSEFGMSVTDASLDRKAVSGPNRDRLIDALGAFWRDLIKTLKDFDIICAMRERTPFRRETLQALPKLKLLLTSGMRNASFDMEAAKERGVVVCGTGGFGNPTAALAIGLMLELTRKIGFENARLKAGAPWQITMGLDAEGLTMGIVGLGRHGARVAEGAKAICMMV